MSKLTKQLKIQEDIEGLNDDLLLVKFWANIVLQNSRSSNMFYSMVNVKHYRYGKLSYECHTFYYPTEELKLLTETNS